MNTGLNHACGSGTHPHAQRGADMYETPPVAVEALLRAEKLPHVVWEPAAGRGAIVNVLRAAGHSVIASDLIDYGVAAIQGGRDFLKKRRRPQAATPSSRTRRSGSRKTLSSTRSISCPL